MRIFVGLPMPDLVKNAYKKLQLEIAPLCKNAHFVAADNLHLTLLFIGEMSLIEVQYFHQALQVFLGNISRFSLLIQNLGLFDKAQRKILYYQLKDAPVALFELVSIIQNTAQSCGLCFEVMPFKPHITIARQLTIQDASLCTNKKIDPLLIEMKHIHLYVSERVDGVLRYTPMKTYELL